MEQPPLNSSPWSCPNCGDIAPEQVVVCNERLMSEHIPIPPILPTCAACGAELVCNVDGTVNPEIRVIVLTGTCASGKKTIAQQLARRHGFRIIDGNVVRDVVRHKLGIRNAQFNGDEMIDEITRQIDILSALHQDIVLSHVIVPDDLPRYRAIFRQRQLRYRIFVLQPDCTTAIARSKERTCFNGITDEHWIRHFHEQLSVLEQQEETDVIVYDNAGENAEASAERIMQFYLWAGEASPEPR
ncbi:MAG: AAA family ATPase [Armatimonadota bacterium]